MGFIYTKSGKLAKRLYFGAVLLFEGLYYTFKNRVLADGGTFVENELPTISQDAKLVLTPNAYKAGKLYSAVPNDGTGDFTVVRNSTATYIDEDGLIKTALANVPRIDWSTGEAALLVEPQRTNLITYSEDFNFWTYVRSSISSSQTISPDGLLGGTKLIANVDNNTHQIQKLLHTGISSSLVYSIFLKKSEFSYCTLRIQDNAANVNGTNNSYFASFDLNTGAFVIDESQGSPINTFHNIEDYGNGWFKCVVGLTKKGDATRTDLQIYIGNVGGMRDIFIGDGISGIYIWGAQIEQASTASSYIPTNGNTVTRLADNISVPTPAGVTSITETKNGVEQAPITTIPATYSLPVGNINKVTMQ